MRWTRAGPGAICWLWRTDTASPFLINCTGLRNLRGGCNDSTMESVIPGLSELYTAFDSDPNPIIGFLKRIARAYELPEPMRVLDVGCGPGRLLRPLARLGWEVTGMEPNPEFLACARGIAGENRRVKVRPGGFQEVDADELYDLVIGINSSFAHVLSPAERAGSIRRAFRALRPGGVLFLDLPNLLWILKNYQPPRPHASVVLGREVTLHRRHEIDYDRATFTTIDDYEIAGAAAGPVEFVHAYGIVTAPELRAHLVQAGFAQIRTYQSYDSAESEHVGGPRMLIAARKSGSRDGSVSL